MKVHHRRAAVALAPYAVLILSAIFLCLAMALAVSGSLRSGASDEARYAELSAMCNKKYNDDIAGGIKYAYYPCEDTMLKAEFKKKYGYDYQ